MYSPRLLGKKSQLSWFFPKGREWLYTGYKFIFGDSTFTTEELSGYLLSHSLLAVSSDFSPSTESDQEAALLAADTSSDVSKVGRFVLVIKHETGEDQDEKEIMRGASPGRFLNNSYISQLMKRFWSVLDLSVLCGVALGILMTVQSILQKQ